MQSHGHLNVISSESEPEVETDKLFVPLSLVLAIANYSSIIIINYDCNKYSSS